MSLNKSKCWHLNDCLNLIRRCFIADEEIEGSNPAAAWLQEKMADKESLYRQWPVLVAQ
jgi:hypothetical protein